jgi:hypothetical protein
MLHLSTINTNTLELLKLLMKMEAFSATRLVGGTSLALQLGHRKSIDLDFFGKINFAELNRNETFNQFREVVTIKLSANINVLLINGIKVDFVNYSYPWLEPALSNNGIRLAGLKDIAAMKLAAVTGRGSKKDFIDIYFLLEKFTLSDLMSFYKEKYVDGSEYMVLKSLAYFEDAENDPMPEMIEDVNWEDVKMAIIKEVKDII